MTLVRFNKRFSQPNDLMNLFFGSNPLTEANNLLDDKHYTTPKVNITETDKDFSIEVAAPGFDKNDFKLSLENNTLSIEASKEEGKKDQQYAHYEFAYGTFKRTFSLPENKVKEADISAKYKNGILHISLPKKDEAKAEAKRLIDIL